MAIEFFRNNNQIESIEAYRKHKLAAKELEQLKRLWAHIQGQREQISRQFPSALPAKTKQATLEQ